MSYGIEIREEKKSKRGDKYGCDLMPQQRGLIDPKLYEVYELMRRRNGTGVYAPISQPFSACNA